MGNQRESKCNSSISIWHCIFLSQLKLFLSLMRYCFQSSFNQHQLILQSKIHRHTSIYQIKFTLKQQCIILSQKLNQWSSIPKSRTQLSNNLKKNSQTNIPPQTTYVQIKKITIDEQKQYLLHQLQRPQLHGHQMEVQFFSGNMESPLPGIVR